MSGPSPGAPRPDGPSPGPPSPGGPSPDGPTDVAGILPIVVDDAGDPRLTPYVALTDVRLRHEIESEHGVFVAEGLIVLARLLRSPYRLRSVLLTPSKLRAVERDPGLAAAIAASGAPVYVADRPVMDAVAGFALHRGAVAVAERRPLEAVDALLSDVSRVLVLEGLNDVQNLGAIARTAAAFGVGGVVLDPTCADPFYRRALRVSMGEALGLRWARAEDHDWPAGVIGAAHAAGMRCLALTPSGETALADVHAGPDDRIAWLLGAEGPGLSAAALAAADARVRIAINPAVDSLNVGAAAAVALSATSPYRT